MSAIAVDFDGVLCDPKNVDEGRRMGNPVWGARDAMQALRRKGFKLIIHTVRGGSPKHVEDWLRFYSIPFDEVTNIKPNDVAFFIDDHALRFDGDWDATLAQMKALDAAYQAKKTP